MHTSEFPLHYDGVGADKRVQHGLRRRWLAFVVVVLVMSGAHFVRTIPRTSVVSAVATRISATDSRAAGVVTSFTPRHSHNHRYSAEVLSASPIALGAQQTWMIRLSRRGHRVSRATVAAEAWMPETGQRAPVRPSVRYVGSGNYRLDGLVLDGAGLWNVALVIDARYGTDSVAFNVIVPR